jgi:periplasmic protein TonB
MPYDFAFQEKVTDVTDTSSAANNPPASPSSDANAPQKVRVSQAVSQGLLIHKVTPVYPQRAKTYNVQGTVVLRAQIGKDGHIENLKVVSGPPELVDAAEGAVSQWRYRPYVINGDPVTVETTITVNFQLH